MAIERTWLDVLADCTVDRLPYLSSRSYEERLRALELPTLHYRQLRGCLLYTSPSPRDRTRSRMPSSA